MDIIDLSQGDLDFTKVESLDHLNQVLQPFVENHREIYSQLLAHLEPFGQGKFTGMLTYSTIMGEGQTQAIVDYLASKMPEAMQELRSLLENTRDTLNTLIGDNDLIVKVELEKRARESLQWMDQLGFRSLGIRDALKTLFPSSKESVAKPTESRRKKRAKPVKEYVLPFRMHLNNQGDPKILEGNVATWFENNGLILPPEHRSTFEYLSLLSVSLLEAIRSSEDVNELCIRGEYFLRMMRFMFDLGMKIETDIHSSLIKNLPSSELFEEKVLDIPESFKAVWWQDMTFGISGEILAHAIAEGLLRAAEIDGNPLSIKDCERAGNKLMEAEGWSSPLTLVKIHPTRAIILEWLSEKCPLLLAPLNKPKANMV